jgi:hypothetical protein
MTDHTFLDTTGFQSVDHQPVRGAFINVLDLDKVVAQLDVCKQTVAGLTAELETCRRRNRELEMR